MNLVPVSAVTAVGSRFYLSSGGGLFCTSEKLNLLAMAINYVFLQISVKSRKLWPRLFHDTYAWMFRSMRISRELHIVTEHGSMWVLPTVAGVELLLWIHYDPLASVAAALGCAPRLFRFAHCLAILSDRAIGRHLTAIEYNWHSRRAERRKARHEQALLRCPICRHLSKRSDAIEGIKGLEGDASTCCVCLTETSSVCLQCGHVCLCGGCLERLLRSEAEGYSEEEEEQEEHDDMAAAIEMQAQEVVAQLGLDPAQIQAIMEAGPFGETEEAIEDRRRRLWAEAVSSGEEEDDLDSDQDGFDG